MLKEILLFFIFLLYAAAHVTILTVWAIHIYYVRRGTAGILAPRWSLIDLWVGLHLVLLLTLGTLAIAVVGFGFLAGVLLPEGWSFQFLRRSIESSENLLWVALFVVLLWQNVALTAVSVWYVLGRYQLSPQQMGLGWNWRLVRRGVWWGAAAFLITPLIEVVCQTALRLLLGTSGFEQLTRWEQQTDLLERFFTSLQNEALLVGFLGVAVVAAPIGEELFFRGFVFNLLRHRWSTKGALWISSAFFAALHGSITNFVPLLVIGLLLAYLYLRTGSLWSSVLMHGTFNLLSTLAALIIGG